MGWWPYIVFGGSMLIRVLELKITRCFGSETFKDGAQVHHSRQVHVSLGVSGKAI
ncbi:hypothetical protein M758_1G262100 [Ceratodon purpureus]|uniref:Uncharacterized protein n=1 Tax=Ceratodon purpureus TaxID=3225 RepID=A0A8T0JCM0_CERPU|nr:hypothetical protein KC19_1G269700 [Ceratodon purpureus]KAG0631558.1 hypothetical protein M758_1G262100 [Ceratodon purpureus]